MRETEKRRFTHGTMPVSPLESQMPSVTRRIPISLLDPNPFACRQKKPEADGLIGSMRKNGQLCPVKVRPSPDFPGRFQIIFGHMRVDAATALNWSSVLAEVVDASDEQMITFALTENLDRNNYTDYEIGLLLRCMVEEFSKSVTEISAMIGRSKSYVSDHIAMTHLFDDCSLEKNKAADLLNSLTEHQARIIARIRDASRRLNTAKLTIDEKLGVKELEILVGHNRGSNGENQLDTYSEPRSPTFQDKVQITDMVKHIMDGLSNKDLRPLESFRYSKYFSLYDDFPPRLELLDYDQAIEQNFSVIKEMDIFSVQYSRLKINVLGKFAYATFMVTYRMSRLGKWCSGKSRVTFVLLKEDKKWMILHEHWSPLEFEFVKALYSFDYITGAEKTVSESFRTKP